MEKSKSLYLVVVDLMLLVFLWCIPFSDQKIDVCFEDFDIADDDSSVQLQNCTTDVLEFAFEISGAIDNIRIELACSDNQSRVLLSKNSLQTSSSISFDIHPPLITTLSSDTICTTTICYEDLFFYDPYIFQFIPMFHLQRDCVPYKQTIPSASKTTTSSIDYLYSLTPDFDEDIFANVSTNDATAVLPSTTTTSNEESLGSLSTTTKLLSISLVNTSSKINSMSSSPIAPPHSSQQFITSSSSLYNMDEMVFGSNTAFLTSNLVAVITNEPSTAQPAADPVQSIILATMISVIVLATCIFVIIAMLFCIFRIVTQYRKRWKIGIEDISSIEVMDIKKSDELTPSPSICTILWPLSPIINEDIDSSPYYEVVTLNGSLRVVPVKIQYNVGDNTTIDGVPSANMSIDECLSTREDSSNLSLEEEHLSNEEKNSYEYIHTATDIS